MSLADAMQMTDREQRAISVPQARAFLDRATHEFEYFCDSCRDDDGLVMGHGEGGLAIVGTGLDQVSAHTVSSSDSQVALGVVNVHLYGSCVKRYIHTYIHPY